LYSKCHNIVNNDSSTSYIIHSLSARKVPKCGILIVRQICIKPSLIPCHSDSQPFYRMHPFHHMSQCYSPFQDCISDATSMDSIAPAIPVLNVVMLKVICRTIFEWIWYHSC